jgi:hypothetical protein
VRFCGKTKLDGSRSCLRMDNLSSIKDSLGNLKGNLPNYSSTELNSSFKQAAQAISLLYTESSKISKRGNLHSTFCHICLRN